ncbi:hypothetical protein ANACAC_00457 [Anaerostipes caccae L1-92]|uniref:Uncharacterized protein n=1 Tax=Anaerostipes caccae (strain DSM 14662 / CCUG 47493 / JCM 13470 / NCIMB 13811 / L1-92) TaxID=411490 RepID=B0MA82_ANACD|nr:hypothetical protein ANACAC_00457 [Anaerostipes caccae L1-92]
MPGTAKFKTGIYREKTAVPMMINQWYSSLLHKKNAVGGT